MNRESYRNKERDIIFEGATGGGGEIFSNLTEYAAAFDYDSREAFVEELKGKTILDLGSGLGGLAKDVFAKDVDCRIVSLNPRLSKAESRQAEKKATSDYALAVFPEPSFLEKIIKVVTREPKKNHVQEMQAAHDKGAVAGFAHALPFRDGVFDLILDKDAVSKFAARIDMDFVDRSTPEEKEIFREALREMIRVLKPGGTAKIFDIFGYGSSKDWKQNILDELGLKYQLIEVDRVRSGLPPWFGNNNVAIGVEIKKH